MRLPPNSTRKRGHPQGAVTKVEWVNPHVWIHVDVKKPDGKVESWAMKPARRTCSSGALTKQSLKSGTEVVINGYQAKDGTRRANGRDVKLADGSKLFLGGSGATGAPYEIK